MKHELLKKKKLALGHKKSIRGQLKIKFLIDRIVPTQDFASKAQEHRRTNFLPWEEITMASAFYY